MVSDMMVSAWKRALCALACLGLGWTAQAWNFSWVKGSSDGTAADDGKELALAADGSLYVSGETDSTRMSLAGFHLTNATPESDAFVAKFDRGGNVLWFQSFPGGSVARSLAVDAAGDLYFGGYITNGVTVAGTNYPSTGSFDYLLMKMDAAGNPRWVRTGGGAYSDILQDVIVDTNGVYATGFFRDTANFGSLSLTVPTGGPTRSDFYLVKYSPDGTAQWARRGGGSGDDVGAGVASDPVSGAIYVCGYFQATATFGSTNVTSAGSDEAFVAKYDADGNFLWVQKMGGSGSDKAVEVATDASGNVYTTGFFSGTAAFGPTNLTSNGGTDLFLTKHDAEGNLLWAERAGGTADDAGDAVFVAASGRIYLTGKLTGAVTAGTNVIAAADPTNSTAFVAAVDAASGHWEEVKRVSSGNSSGSGIAVDAAERIYLTGSFFSPTSWDSLTLTNGGGADFFLARLDASVALRVKRAGGQIVATWPTNALGYTLQSAAQLNPPAAWQNVGITPEIVNGEWAVTNSPVAMQFYRLTKP